MYGTILKIIAATVAISTVSASNAQVRSGPRPQFARPSPTPSRPTPTSSLPKAVTPPSAYPRNTAIATPRSVVGQAKQAPSRLHGNSLSSNRPQHVYGIYGVNKNSGTATTYKYGISGGSSRLGNQLPSSMQRQVVALPRDYSDRGLGQARQLNKLSSHDPVKYSTRVLVRVPPQPPGQPTARQVARKIEDRLVGEYQQKRGDVPIGNPIRGQRVAKP